MSTPSKLRRLFAHTTDPVLRGELALLLSLRFTARSWRCALGADTEEWLLHLDDDLVVALEKLYAAPSSAEAKAVADGAMRAVIEAWTRVVGTVAWTKGGAPFDLDHLEPPQHRSEHD